MSATAEVPNSSESEPSGTTLDVPEFVFARKNTGERRAAQALATPRLHRFLFAVAGDWLVIVAAMMAARRIDALWAYAAATVVVGQRQYGLGVLAHDGSHRLATRTRWVNDLVTNVFCFGPIGVVTNAYRAVHFDHHRYTNTERDSEMAYRRLAPKEWTLPRTPQRIVLRFAMDLVGLGAVEVVHLIQ
jgi:fatty acid desaturase